MSMKRIALDIGANVGEFTFDLARRNPELTVVAVEPVTSLAEKIRRDVEEQGVPNVTVLDVALGRWAGETTMNVAELGDWGVSSMLDFDAESLADDEYWSTRSDLRFTTKQTVRVQTLADVLVELDPEVVEFCKIDVQGLDLQVLESAGEQLGRIRAGVLEVPTVARARLYAEERDTLHTALNFLTGHGFEVYALKPNDPACNEMNVYFIRAGEDPRELEAALGLRGIHLYDGKHFWGSWASSMAELEADQARLRERDERAAVLDARVRELEARIAVLEPLAGQAAGGEQPTGDALLIAGAEPEGPRAAQARWAQAVRELEEARRSCDLLAEKERRASLALRAARETLTSSTARENLLLAELHDRDLQISDLRHSTSWRVTWPLRVGGHRARRIRAIANKVRQRS